MFLAATAVTAMLVVGTVLAAPQTPSRQAQSSDQVFKNVQVLKGIPVDDFMGTMGLMSAAVGYDCSECHIGAGTDGLLLRVLRYGNTPIGRVPTQVDYDGYREVNGIKIPFRLTFAWLDGRDAIQLSEVQTNVPIDAARFGRPTATNGR